MQLQRTPASAKSSATHLVIPTTANLVAQYASRSRTPTIPPIEAMLMIDPPRRSTIDGRGLRHEQHALDVHRGEPVEVVACRRQGVADVADPGVVHQHVASAAVGGDERLPPARQEASLERPSRICRPTGGADLVDHRPAGLGVALFST